METLQSRLDADFLLAHMCSVKFKEWIVVLATLLRRSEVLHCDIAYMHIAFSLLPLCFFFCKGRHLDMVLASFPILAKVHFVGKCILLMRFYRCFSTCSHMMFGYGKHTAPRCSRT
ncbi:hypothetical protein HN51_067323 [Arachis hypogaea]